MIIDIDIGNSRIKWRFADEPKALHILAMDAVLPEQWKNLPPRSRFRISSVVGPAKTGEFTHRLALLGEVIIEMASVKSPFDGLSLAYSDAGTFGVDRWLALLAAKERYPLKDCIVVHAGTALVADFLRRDGQHLGGYITAGWQTSLRSMADATHALGAFVSGAADFRRRQPGATTLECIEAGASVLFQGFLRELRIEASAHLRSPQWIFSGGDAEIFLDLWRAGDAGVIAGEADIAQELVLDGLAIALA